MVDFLRDFWLLGWFSASLRILTLARVSQTILSEWFGPWITEPDRHGLVKPGGGGR